MTTQATPPRTSIDREVAEGHGLASYKEVPGHRSYALDDQAALGFGALSAAYAESVREAGADFTRAGLGREVLKPLAKLWPALAQDRPDPEPEAPKPWQDAITGEVARNPFSDPVDRESQRVLRERDSGLAAHLEELAKGVSYARLAKLKDESEAREIVRRLPYGEAEHKGNVFNTTDLQARANFARNSHSAVIAFFQREASTSVEPPINDLTQLGVLTKHNPELRKLVARSREIHAQWVADDLVRLEEAKTANEAAIQKARSLTNA